MSGSASGIATKVWPAAQAKAADIVIKHRGYCTEGCHTSSSRLRGRGWGLLRQYDAVEAVTGAVPWVAAAT